MTPWTIDETLRRRISWAVLLLACLSYIGLGLAEEGARGSTVQSPPGAPLPFTRERIFGLDLTHLTSLQARDWLSSSGGGLALVAVPIDGDVVAALSDEEGREQALAAVDSIVQAAGGSPLAACLRRPAVSAGQSGVAEAAVSVLVERYPTSILYISACRDVGDDAWQRDIARATSSAGPLDAISPDGLVPLSAGPRLDVHELADSSHLSAAQLQFVGADAATLVVLDVEEMPDDTLVRRAAEALRESPQLALVMLRPEPHLDPAGLAGSVGGVVLAADSLPGGFSSVTSPPIIVDDGWELASAGAVQYLRSGVDSALAVDFVGTDVYLYALRAPDAGKIQVWIDPLDDGAGAAPILTIDLEGSQARDALIPIVEGLPAARHTLLVQAVNDDGTNVMLSGIFVTGKPAPAWTAGLAAAGLILCAILSIAERSFASVTALRRRIRPVGHYVPSGHPRVFTRHH